MPSQPTADPQTWLHVLGFLLGHYQDLCTRLEDTLESSRAEAQAKIASTRIRTAEDDLHFWALDFLYPNTLRFAVLVTVYSQFEFYLEKVCRELERTRPGQVTLKDLRGKGITRSYLYLKKVTSLMEPFRKVDWDRLKDVNKIRNLIVHSGGTALPENKEYQDLLSRVKGWTSISLRDNLIELSRAFNNDVIHLICSSTRHLVDQL